MSSSNLSPVNRDPEATSGRRVSCLITTLRASKPEGVPHLRRCQKLTPSDKCASNAAPIPERFEQENVVKAQTVGASVQRGATDSYRPRKSEACARGVLATCSSAASRAPPRG